MTKLSVIIPTRNRAPLIKNALQSIIEQTIEPDTFETLVIDNGSTDNTKSVVASYYERLKNLRYIYDDAPGLHIGRNRGLLESNSEILVFADDDIEAQPSWLEAILQSFTDQDVALVGGKNLPKFESSPPGWVLDMWRRGGDQKILGHLSILDFGDEEKEINPHYVFGCNFSIRKKILLQAGGFHPDGMPDELIMYRGDGESYVSKYITDMGYKAVYNPKASVHHMCSTNRMTKEYFAKRSFNQGISDSYTDIREKNKKNLLKTRIILFIQKHLMNRDVYLNESYIKGYRYHQRQVARNKMLLEWVTRENYIENGRIR